MASIKEAAQNVLDEAKEEIAWIALWREGKGWASRAFWPEVDADGAELRFDADDRADLEEILGQDANAIIVNPYYHNLGPTEMTRDSLANALRWQYEGQTSRIAGHLQEDAA